MFDALDTIYGQMLSNCTYSWQSVDVMINYSGAPSIGIMDILSFIF